MGIKLRNAIYFTNDLNIYKLIDKGLFNIKSYLICGDAYTRESKIYKSYVNYFKDLEKPYNHKLSLSEDLIYRILTSLSMESEAYIVPDFLSKLDLNKEEALMKVLRNISTKKPVIVVNYDPDTYLKYADYVLLFENRRLKYYGKTLDIFKRDDYYLDDLNRPSNVEITRLAKDKNINLKYTKEYQDLIKDIYKHVKKNEKY